MPRVLDQTRTPPCHATDTTHGCLLLVFCQLLRTPVFEDKKEPAWGAREDTFRTAAVFVRPP